MDRMGGRATPSFGDLLRGHRGARLLTQEELAERSGLSVDAISALERGLRTAPRSSTVEALARALQLDASERDALASAARGSRPAAAARVEGPTLGRLLRPLRKRWTRRAGLVGLLAPTVIAVLAITTLAIATLGSRPAPHAFPAPPPPEPLPAGPSAVVYYDAADPAHVRQVGYDGTAVDVSWWTVLDPHDPIRPVVGISPDGEYAVTRDLQQADWLILGAQGQVVSTIASTMDSIDFGAWANDSRHICRMGIADPLQWQVAVTDLQAPDSPPATVPVGHLTDPPYVTIAACDAAAGRAVVVQPMTDTQPAPPSAPRRALLIDLSTGRIVTTVPLGDGMHGVVYSLDGRYLASIDYVRGTSSIVSLLSGRTVWTDRGEVRAFSGDDSRVVENSRFEPPGTVAGTTRVVDWTTGRVLYSTGGHTTKVSSQPTGAALALNVERAVPDGPADVVVVPASGAGTVLQGAVLF